MIVSFADEATAAVFDGKTSPRFPPSIHSVARRKLNYLEAATALKDLLVPPGNRLETLKGDRAGQWSIRVNDQFRICFRWSNGNAYEAELTDYH